MRVGHVLVACWGIASLCVAIDAAEVADIKQSPLEVHVERAFPNISIERPVFLTHSGDGTNRLFVGSQYGRIFVLPNDEKTEEAQLFLDITDRVTYKDEENEEGLLGLAFHPNFNENGEFFVYYTAKSEKRLSTISRFKVDPSNPQKADPASEEILMTLKQPFWNHNGGTLAFGPDGFLYIGLGDGGKGADPLLSGQDLSTLLGKILRIDVDNKSPGLAYAIPKDNPFVGREGARPEIYAYGFRNIWRMAFDPASGNFWVADVGQDLLEEINLVTKGGNYGWSLREGKQAFKNQNQTAPTPPIDPIWDYPHNESWGKSITGGMVYHGQKVPALKGSYLYGDYVSGKLWALRYDSNGSKVVANQPILWPPSLPVVTFGSDEQGEVYFTTVTSGGRIYKFVEGPTP
jgi:glucose/arabinose dehydrogenase